MKEINASLGFIGLAAMSYVSHITNHPAFCKFFLITGVAGVVLAVVTGVLTSVVEGIRKGK